jgi:hypothetical protein
MLLLIRNIGHCASWLSEKCMLETVFKDPVKIRSHKNNVVRRIAFVRQMKHTKCVFDFQLN